MQTDKPFDPFPTSHPLINTFEFVVMRLLLASHVSKRFEMFQQCHLSITDALCMSEPANCCGWRLARDKAATAPLLEAGGEKAERAAAIGLSAPSLR